MRRKLIALLTSAVLALSLLGTTASTVAASRTESTGSVAFQLANRGSCGSGASVTVGQQILGAPGISNNVSDVIGYIDVPDDKTNDFNICNGISSSSAAIAWLGLTPDSGGMNAIVQIGRGVCTSNPWASYCSGTNSNGQANSHFFYAFGGCSSAGTIVDLGADNDNWSHYFTLQTGWSGGHRWVGGSIGTSPSDAVWKFTLWDTDLAGVGCWLDQSLNASISGETHKYGDSLGTNAGTVPSSRTQNSWGIQYAVDDGIMRNPPGWYNGYNCTKYAEAQDHCLLTGSQALSTWSTN